MNDVFPEIAPETPPRSSRRRSWLRRFVLGLLLLVVLGLAGIIVYAKYFLPVDLIRIKIETIASDALKQTVRIDGLVLDPFTGFEVSGIHVDVEGKRAIDLDRVLLKYRLLPLLKMKFVIDELLIADTSIDLRLEDLLAGLQTDAKEPEHEPEEPDDDSDSETAEPPEIPAIPLAIELNRFAISNSNIMLILNDDLSVSTTGLNLNLAAAVKPEGAKLTGSLSIAELGSVVDGKAVKLPMEVDWDIAFDFDTETLTIDHVRLDVGSALTIAVRGSVADVMRTRRVDLAVHDTTINIEALLAMVQDFVPDSLAGLAVSGTIHPSLAVSGGAGGGAFDGKVKLGLSVRGLAATVPTFQAVLKPTNVTIEVPQLAVANNMPDAATLSVAINSEGASFEEHVLDTLDLELVGNYAATGEVATSLFIDGEAVHVAVPDMGQVTVPLAVALKVHGNYTSLDLTLERLTVDLGSLLHIAVDARARQDVDNPDARQVELNVDVQPNLAQLLALVPEELLSGLQLTPSDRPDSMKVRVKATLDADHVPQSARVTSHLAFHSLGVVVSEPQAAVTLDALKVSVAADYLQVSGAVNATVKGEIGLSGLSQGDNLISVGTVGVDLGADIEANLSSDFKPERLVATNIVKVRVKDIGYTTPELAVGLDSLDLSVKAKQDLIAGSYQLEQLTVDARPVFLVNASATYHDDPKTFAVNVGIPEIDFAHLIKTASGELLAEQAQTEITGTMGLSLRASGRVPDREEIDALSIPVSLQTRFQMQDIDVQWQGHTVDNARAKMSISFLPEENHRAEIMTELRVDTVGLPEELPLRQVVDPFISVKLDSTNFDEVQLKHVKLGMQGAEVDVSGTIAGFRKALTQSPLDVGRLIEQVFVQITAKAAINLGALDEVLQPQGITATGTAGVTLQALKKDRGPITVSIQLDSHDVNAELEGIRVVDVDSSISVRKALQWMSADGDDIRKTVFHPADRVSALRVHSGPHDMFSFRELEIGSIIADNLSSHIEFDGSSFKIQNLVLNLLNGGIGGDVVITTGETLGLDARVQLSEIDMNALLDAHAQVEGDARVTGTLVLRVFLDDARKSIDFGSMEVLLNITTIGWDVLDRVLLFLDPEGSNPMIVMARSKVSLGNPSHAIIHITKGLLAMEIGFQQGLLSGFKVDRIPVSTLKNLHVMDTLVPVVEQLAGAVEMIEAQQYGVDENGTFVLR